MVNDTVGDFIIRIKNAGMIKKENVRMPYSKHIHAIAEKLANAGYVEAVHTEGTAQRLFLIVTLKYTNDSHCINDVRRISKPGRRLYRKATEIHPIKFGHGDMILSTPQGILTGGEARAAHVGGEELFRIW